MSMLVQFLIAAALIAVFIMLRVLTERRVNKERCLHAQSDETCSQLACTTHCEQKQSTNRSA